MSTSPSEFNYLRGFVSLLEKTEVPPRFAIWCGIASLLASLERRVWVPQGIYTVYPNFYIVLVAASGQKKSTAVNTAAKLLRSMTRGPNVIAQKVSPEALIAAVKTVEVSDERGLCRKRSGGIVIADELATFLDRNALERGLGPMLTALFDCEPFEYQTLSRGVERVEDGYLSILGGTTVELLKNSLPRDAIGGGFTSRTMFVYEDAVSPPVAWIEHDETLLATRDQCIAHLDRLSQLAGPVSFTQEAKEAYIVEYNQRHRNSQFRSDPGLQNYENRRHAHLIKVAIALMLSEYPTLIMEARHIHGAITILSEAERYLPRVIELLTASDTGMISNAVLAYIRQCGAVPRYQLVRQFSSKMSAQELSFTLNTLMQAAQVEADTINGQLVYRIPGITNASHM